MLLLVFEILSDLCYYSICAIIRDSIVQDLVIGGSVFPHKRIHKATWKHPNGIVENQIDHITYSRKFRRCFSDVRVMKGATVGSDHYLVVGSLRLKLKETVLQKLKEERDLTLLFSRMM